MALAKHPLRQPLQRERQADLRVRVIQRERKVPMEITQAMVAPAQADLLAEAGVVDAQRMGLDTQGRTLMGMVVVVEAEAVPMDRLPKRVASVATVLQASS